MVVPTLGFRGGIERHAFDLAGSLRARGHEVSLVHGEERGRDVEAFVAGFDDVEALSAPRAATRADVAYVQKARAVEDVGPLGDLPMAFAIHDHDLTCPRAHRYVPVGLRPCHAAPGLGCVTHGCVVVRDRRPGALPLRVVNPFAFGPRLEAIARRGPLTTCSAYVADRVVDAGAPRGRVHVVHPIAPEDPADDARVAPPSAPELAIVGQLIRGKGVDLAIRALGWLPRDVLLTVAGEGSMRPELEALASELAPGRVRFSGYVTPERTRAIYDAARVVLVPSRWPEPFGMVGVEAMRRGRVVVGARHGGIPEWLAPEGGGGRAFAPGDEIDLARAIRLALRDDGEAAARFVRAKFRHTETVERVEQVLAQAMR